MGGALRPIDEWSEFERRRYAIAVAMASELVNTLDTNRPKAELFGAVVGLGLRTLSQWECELNESRCEPSEN